jgi:hypothetical protein
MRLMRETELGDTRSARYGLLDLGVTLGAIVFFVVAVEAGFLGRQMPRQSVGRRLDSLVTSVTLDPMVLMNDVTEDDSVGGGQSRPAGEPPGTRRNEAKR